QPVELVELRGTVEVLGELVDEQQRAVDLAGAVARPAEHVRRDRAGDQLEGDDEEQGQPDPDAAQLDRQPEHEQHEPEHLGLGRRVHACQQVGEAQDAQPRDERQERPAEEQDGGDDVEHGVEHQRSSPLCSRSSTPSRSSRSTSTDTMTVPPSSSSAETSASAARSAMMCSSSSRVRMRPSSPVSATANRAIAVEPMKPTSARTTSTGTRSVRRVAAAMRVTTPMSTAVVTSRPRMRSNMLGPRSTRVRAATAAARRTSRQTM